MESNRKRYTFIQLSVNNKGIALIQAILISVLALVVLGGFYFALTRFIGSTQTIKTYASVRDAAIGGIEYGVSIINTHTHMILEALGSSDSSASSNSTILCFDARTQEFKRDNPQPITIRFRIYGTDKLFTNKITVCVTGFKEKEGYPISGVGYSKRTADLKGNLYTMIISEAEGPNNTKSIIEATYLP
ncbi:MAG: hypothetical protein RMI01_08490 [Thermodesulfovibrio sp.]|nr:hypothetical protein [Thermodesulfovibrio sp.]